MVKGYDPVGGEYEFMPSPNDEAGAKYYLAQEVWTFNELCSLISGIDPYMGVHGPHEEIKWEEAENKIKRAVVSKSLKSILMFDETYFLPKEAIAWANQSCTDFPFPNQDNVKTYDATKITEAIGNKKAANLYKLIGVLALTLGKKKSGSNKNLADLYRDAQALIKELESIEPNLSKYGLGESSFYEAVQKGLSLLQEK